MPPVPVPSAAHSRRSFLLVGAGSVAVGAGAATGVLTGVPSAGGTTDEGPADVAGTVVAYVRDVASGEITLMAGDRERVVTDAALARTLARLAV